MINSAGNTPQRRGSPYPRLRENGNSTPGRGLRFKRRRSEGHTRRPCVCRGPMRQVSWAKPWLSGKFSSGWPGEAAFLARYPTDGEARATLAAFEPKPPCSCGRETYRTRFALRSRNWGPKPGQPRAAGDVRLRGVERWGILAMPSLHDPTNGDEEAISAVESCPCSWGSMFCFV